MTLLQPAVSSSAFLKMGLLGFQGGGKTLTSAKVAIGLVKHLQKMGLAYADKPVAMLDTEKGSDWLIPIFKAAGVPFVVAKKKTFADMITVMKEAEAGASCLIIDSITHPWRELVESYLRKKERSYLQMDDWGYLKGEHGWQKFTDAFVNSQLHIIMAGRAGYEYETYVEDGRKKMDKVGTKMKTEGETGFEPDLLVLMEQVEDMHTNKVVHRATVQKDRSTILDGKQIDNPGFEDFLPHIQCLALGQAHIGVGESSSRDSQHMLKIERRDWQPVQRKIVHDEITSLLTLHYPGQTAEHKTSKIKALIKHFDASWTEIEEVMSLPKLRAGYDTLYRELEGKPSKYAEFVEALTADMNDSLPEHSAPPAAIAAEGEPKRSLKETLLADLANNNTIADCVSWSMTVSNMKGLSAEDHIELGKALMKRQSEIGKNPGAGGGNGGGDEGPEKNKPEGDRPNEGLPHPAEQKPHPEPERRVAKGTPAPAQAERTMADLMTAG